MSPRKKAVSGGVKYRHECNSGKARTVKKIDHSVSVRQLCDTFCAGL